MLEDRVVVDIAVTEAGEVQIRMVANVDVFDRSMGVGVGLQGNAAPDRQLIPGALIAIDIASMHHVLRHARRRHRVEGHYQIDGHAAHLQGARQTQRRIGAMRMADEHERSRRVLAFLGDAAPEKVTLGMENDFAG